MNVYFIFELFGIVFYGAQGRSVFEVAVDDGVDGQEVRDGGREEYFFWMGVSRGGGR